MQLLSHNIYTVEASAIGKHFFFLYYITRLMKNIWIYILSGDKEPKVQCKVNTVFIENNKHDMC